MTPDHIDDGLATSVAPKHVDLYASLVRSLVPGLWLRQAISTFALPLRGCRRPHPCLILGARPPGGLPPLRPPDNTTVSAGPWVPAQDLNTDVGTTLLAATSCGGYKSVYKGRKWDVKGPKLGYT